MKNLHEDLEAVRDYTDALEDALIALCEELEIDPVELVEDIQTAARKREMDSKENAAVAKAASLLKAQGRFEPDTATQTKWRSAKKKALSVMRQNEAEAKSKKLYGRGGKVIKQRSR